MKSTRSSRDVSACERPRAGRGARIERQAIFFVGGDGILITERLAFESGDGVGRAHEPVCRRRPPDRALWVTRYKIADLVWVTRRGSAIGRSEPALKCLIPRRVFDWRVGGGMNCGLTRKSPPYVRLLDSTTRRTQEVRGAPD
jgi:hypothetical protein